MRRRLLTPILYLALLACTAAVFLPARNFQFLIWDDPDLLTENPLLHPPTMQHLMQFWTEPYQRLYTPLTYSLWWAVLRLSHGWAGAGTFHWLNVLLHLLCAALVFSILRRCVGAQLADQARDMLGKEFPPPPEHPGRGKEGLHHVPRTVPLAALAGALLFALHPVQVESVAWVAELNNVLGAALALAAIRLHLASGAKTRAAGLIFFLLALLAKPTTVTVPFIAAILDGGLLRLRPHQIIHSLLPWLVAAAGFALVAHAAQSVPGAPIWQRLVVALDALGFYLRQLFWPVHLTMDYARTPQAMWAGRQWIVNVILAVAAGLLAWSFRRRYPAVAVAAGIAFLALLPVLGLIPFVFQHYSTVADRYMYLAMLGPALALAWLMSRCSAGACVGLTVAMSALLVWRCAGQMQTWRDTDTLSGYTLQLDPGSFIGNKIRGEELAREHRWKEAIPYYQTALLRNFNAGDIHYNLANAFLSCGDWEHAKGEYLLAIPLLDGEPRLHAMNNLGIAYFRSGQRDEAEHEFEQVFRLDPGNANAVRNLRLLAGQDVPSR